MHMSDSTIREVQEKREKKWEELSFTLESERAFRRARFRASIDSFMRRFGKRMMSLKRGQSLIGRRSTDRTEAFCLPVSSVSGMVDADGRAFLGFQALSPKLLPVWRNILRQADSLPTPRAYLLGGMWFLEASGLSLLALEAARYLGRGELTVVAAVRALGRVDCGSEATEPEEMPWPPENARMAC
jgi:hypothetical protein